MTSNSEPTTEPTKDDLSDEQARRMIEQTRLALLETTWTLGRKVIEARKSEAAGNVIEDLVKRLNVSNETLLQAEQFAKYYVTREELDRAARLGLTASHVRALLSPHLSDTTRRKLEERVAKEHMGVEEFTKEVTALIRRSGKTVMRKPETAVGMFIKIAQAAEKLLGLLKTYGRAKKGMAWMKGDAFKDTMTAKAETDMALRKLRFDINDIARDEGNVKWWTKR